MRPETKYAKSGKLSIAYQVTGDGPLDLVLVLGFVSHIDVAWEEPHLAQFLNRLATFSRLILFDKRGTGLSDPVAEPPTFAQRMDDIRAVMDAAGKAMPLDQLHRFHGGVQVVEMRLVEAPYVALIARTAPIPAGALLPAVQDGFKLPLVVGAPQREAILGPDQESGPMSTGC